MDFESTAGSSRLGDASYANDRTPLLAAERSTMSEKKIGISRQTLVSNAAPTAKGRKLPQYVAALASTLGALAAGTVLAWTSPAGADGKNLAHDYGIALTPTEFSWIGALATLGAAAICIPIGILSDLIGRKTAMLLLVVPFTIGWALVIWANSVVLFYVGRFIIGLSGGAFCVTAPMYTAEIAENDVRGSLGSYFQLLLTAGILLTYVLGSCVDMFWLSVICAVVPVVFFCVFFFMPESPTYHLNKDDEGAARASLVRLRGPEYNVEPELRAKMDAIADARANRVSFSIAIRSKAAIKGLCIGYGLMFFQQLSGVNAIIFYAGSIFEEAGSALPADESTIIVGAIQLVAVFVSTLIVDKLGRRLLLLASEVSMCVTTVIVGVFFYLKQNDPDSVKSIGWLPLASVCIFIIMFSLGYGPIPWMMMGELFSPQIKGIAGSSACLLNWLMAFVVTKFFIDVQLALGIAATFWIFAAISAVGVVFVFFVVPETKGKSLEEIQIELGGGGSESTAPVSQGYDNPQTVKV